MQFLIFCFVSVLLYWPSKSGGWYFDDRIIFSYSPGIKSLSGVFDYLMAPRGLSFFSFALDRLLFGGDPAYSRWVNVAIHSVNTLLTTILLRYLTGDKKWAFVFGLLFLCHPVQTSAVSYVVQRMALLSAMFGIMAIILLDRFIVNYAAYSINKRVFVLLLSVLSGIFSCMSKENTIFLPFLVFPLLWFRGQYMFSAPWKSAFPTLLLVPVTTVALRFLAVDSVDSIHSSAFVPFVDTGKPFYELLTDRSYLPVRYFLSQMEVFWVYLGLVFVPIRQALDYCWPIPDIIPTYLHIATFLLIVSVTVFSYRLKKRFPLSFLGLAWIVIFMLLESSFIPLDPIFEHRLYLPLIGFILICYEHSRNLAQYAGFWSLVVMIIIIIMCSVLTIKRNYLWGDSVVFWKSNAEIIQRGGRPKANLAWELFLNARYNEAAHVFSELYPVYSGYENYRLRLAELKYFAGDHSAAFSTFQHASLEHPGQNLMELYQAFSAINARKYEEASRLLDLADSKQAGTVFGHYLRGLLSEVNELPITALEFYQKAIDKSETATSRMGINFGRAFADKSMARRKILIENLSSWIAAERSKVLSDPNNLNRRGDWANQLLKMGFYEEAIEEYKFIRKKNQNSFGLHYNMGIAYTKIGQSALAEDCYSESLRYSPNNIDVLYNYGMILLERKKLHKARVIFEKILIKNRMDGRVWIGYGSVLHKMKDKEGALKAFEQALYLPGFGGLAKASIDLIMNENMI